MTGTPALYEDPSRLSRMVVISCAVVAALLTFLIVLPPLLSLFGHRSVTPPHNEIDNSASTARTAAANSLDQISQTTKLIPPQTAKPIPSADDVPVAGGSNTAAIAETSGSSGVETPRSEPPAPAPTTNGESSWTAAIQSTPDPGPTLEVDADPVVQPPLPRVRPHRMAAAGIAAVPLPPPRPVVPTDAASTDREAFHERFDPL